MPISEEAVAEPVELSPRQREVLQLLAEGRSARAIAARLGIAETTARNHIHALLRRLGCHSQLQAVALGYRLGLVESRSGEELRGTTVSMTGKAR